jgi:hypothetical protein
LAVSLVSGAGVNIEMLEEQRRRPGLIDCETKIEIVSIQFCGL